MLIADNLFYATAMLTIPWNKLDQNQLINYLMYEYFVSQHIATGAD